MSRIFPGRLILYLFFLLVMDLCLMPVFRAGLVRPVLLYLMILYAAFRWGWERTLPVAIAVGILRDLTASQPLGVETVASVFCAFFLDLAFQKIDRESLVLRFAVVFLFVFLVTFFALTMSAFLGAKTPPAGLGFSICFGTALYSAAVMPLFFNLTARWFRDRVSLKQYELFG